MRAGCGTYRDASREVACAASSRCSVHICSEHARAAHAISRSSLRPRRRRGPTRPSRWRRGHASCGEQHSRTHMLCAYRTAGLGNGDRGVSLRSAHTHASSLVAPGDAAARQALEEDVAAVVRAAQRPVAAHKVVGRGELRRRGDAVGRRAGAGRGAGRGVLRWLACELGAVAGQKLHARSQCPAAGPRRRPRPCAPSRRAAAPRTAPARRGARKERSAASEGVSQDRERLLTETQPCVVLPATQSASDAPCMPRACPPRRQPTRPPVAGRARTAPSSPRAAPRAAVRGPGSALQTQRVSTAQETMQRLYTHRPCSRPRRAARPRRRRAAAARAASGPRRERRRRWGC